MDSVTFNTSRSRWAPSWDPALTTDTYKPSDTFIARYGHVVPFKVDNDWYVMEEGEWAWTMIKPKRINKHQLLWCPVACVDTTDWRRKLRSRNCSGMLMLLAETELASSSRLRTAGTVARFAGPTALPPELFRLICDQVDDPTAARTCRLVCRFWNARCRARALAEVWLWEKVQRVFDLARFRTLPLWQHVPALTQRVHTLPEHSAAARAPWLHLLDPRWARNGGLGVRGPFGGGARTLRSIHFALPRALPRAFSRHFTHVHLKQVRFRVWRDTARLAADLPDLKEIHFTDVSWGTLPVLGDVDPVRRRPRVTRNSLEKVTFADCKNVSPRQAATLSVCLYLSAYNPSSFVPTDALTAFTALLSVMLPSPEVPEKAKSQVECAFNRGVLSVSQNDMCLFSIEMQAEKQSSTGACATFSARFVPGWKDVQPEEWARVQGTLLALKPRPKLTVTFQRKEDHHGWNSAVAQAVFSQVFHDEVLNYRVDYLN